ncbi:cation:proton antiporter regulatory subunit [Aneurinibacillus danicus]|jgi:TrkA domain protein|uniref:Potassium transporter n=1 Tax=Aneurinibacillus danicus TaxID=267746 RepID=A0A511V1Z2_9BACL|nr:cation:proton antiporter regulatory subunit [Aneurinibacillus danicus]GEN32927.1 potassium transporter [Aneurinibacillus danicus]
MLNIKESELPGIGRKFDIETKGKEKLVIVIHDDGRREIYHFDKDDHEESLSNITLNDAESRQIAAILGGMIYKPKALETIEIAFDDLVIEWFKVEENAKAVNKSIGDLDIRKIYSVNIIAIIKKNHKKLLNPGPEAVIEEGDTLVISGERKPLKKLIAELLQKGETS